MVDDIIPSGIIQSGYGTMSFGPSFLCIVCNTPLDYHKEGYISAQRGEKPRYSGLGGISGFYCLGCAQFSPEEGFVAREKWIKESVPLFCSGMPAIILADWIEDHHPGRELDAEWLRTNRSGS